MILSRVSLRSIVSLRLSLRSDDADFGADVISGPDLARPLHGARRARFDLLFRLLGGDHVERSALLDVLARVDEKVGKLGFRDGHRYPRDPDDEVSHRLWLSEARVAQLRQCELATGTPGPRARPRPGWGRT